MALALHTLLGEFSLTPSFFTFLWEYFLDIMALYVKLRCKFQQRLSLLLTFKRYYTFLYQYFSSSKLIVSTVGEIFLDGKPDRASLPDDLDKQFDVLNVRIIFDLS